MNDLKEIVIDNFENAAVIDNYRVSADGLLTKRDGFRVLASFDEPIRGYCYLGDDTLYALAGLSLYRVVNGESTLLGDLSEAVFEEEHERCLMYEYAGVIYIIGGGAFYCFDTTDEFALPKAFEHIPVRQSDHSDYTKEEYNLISERARAVGKFTQSAKVLTIKDEDANIYSVTLDGVALGESQYSLSFSGGLCFIKLTDTSLITGSHAFIVEYVVAPENFESKKSIYSKSTKAYVYDGKSGVRVMLYGGDEGCIYYSEATVKPTDEETGEMLDLTPGTVIGDRYFVGKQISPPNEGEKILDILPFATRTLVITDHATYYLVEDMKTVGGVPVLKGFRLVSMYKELGIGENSGVVTYDGRIYLINPLGLYSMSYNPIEDKYSTYRHTVPDTLGIGRDELGNVRLHVDRINHELWCQLGDRCAVYSFTAKKWYRFSGFTPSSFFTYQNDSAFIEGGRIGVFTVGEWLDGGVGFEAYVETRNLDLGNIFAEKTVYSFGATFERREGAALLCSLKSDKGASFTFRIDADESGADTSPVVKRTHARLGNCYYVICRVSSPADAAPTDLRSILISYRVMGGNV